MRLFAAGARKQKLGGASVPRQGRRLSFRSVIGPQMHVNLLLPVSVLLEIIPGPVFRADSSALISSAQARLPAERGILSASHARAAANVNLINPEVARPAE